MIVVNDGDGDKRLGFEDNDVAFYGLTSSKRTWYTNNWGLNIATDYSEWEKELKSFISFKVDGYDVTLTWEDETFIGSTPTVIGEYPG